MQINIELNRKSIEEAKKQLLYIKKILPQMTRDFLEDVAVWIIDRANYHLNNSDIGENVKIDIRNGWEYDFADNGIKITNATDKAVFVEFGVGIVGQADEHPQASAEGYKYNVKSPYKDKKLSGTWIFKSKMQDLDIPKSQAEFIGDGTEYVVITKGTKGVWYAYNAIVDAQTELEKTGGGEIGKMWEDIKARYIK